MDQANAERIAGVGNQILSLAADVHPKMPANAVFEFLRPRIGRIDRPTTFNVLLEDPYFAREYQTATDPAAMRQELSGVVARLAAIEKLFYTVEPMSPARLMKLLTQRRVVREGLAGPLRVEGKDELLTTMLPEHVLNWAAAADA